MSERIFLILHRKSANEPYVKEAVKAVRKEGIELCVLVPFNKAEKPRVVQEALSMARSVSLPVAVTVPSMLWPTH